MLTYFRFVAVAVAFSSFAFHPAFAQSSVAGPTIAEASSTKVVSACKGLPERACSANSECLWIDYQRETDVRGRQLTDHCRTKRKTTQNAASSD